MATINEVLHLVNQGYQATNGTLVLRFAGGFRQSLFALDKGTSDNPEAYYKKLTTFNDVLYVISTEDLSYVLTDVSSLPSDGWEVPYYKET